MDSRCDRYQWNRLLTYWPTWTDLPGTLAGTSRKDKDRNIRNNHNHTNKRHDRKKLLLFNYSMNVIWKGYWKQWIGCLCEKVQQEDQEVDMKRKRWRRGPLSVNWLKKEQERMVEHDVHLTITLQKNSATVKGGQLSPKAINIFTFYVTKIQQNLTHFLAVFKVVITYVFMFSIRVFLVTDWS
jgi:hypothetical protein